MERETNILEYEDKKIAVMVRENDKKYHLMLRHLPDFLGVAHEEHKDKLLIWFLSREMKIKEAEIIL
jgi:hypothetical protein